MCNRVRSALTQMVNFKTSKLISGQPRNLGLCPRHETIVAMIRKSECTLPGVRLPATNCIARIWMHTVW